MANKVKETSKEMPMNCVCGKQAVVVRHRGGKMVSCPDPMNCKGNFRTNWHGHESSAIAQWNIIIQGAKR